MHIPAESRGDAVGMKVQVPGKDRRGQWAEEWGYLQRPEGAVGM